MSRACGGPQGLAGRAGLRDRCPALVGARRLRLLAGPGGGQGDGGVEQHDAPHPPGRGGGQVQREQPAEGVPHHERAADGLRVEHREQIGDVPLRAPGRIPGGAAMAPQVRRDHTRHAQLLLGQAPVARPRVRDAVDHQQGCGTGCAPGVDVQGRHAEDVLIQRAGGPSGRVTGCGVRPREIPAPAPGRDESPSRRRPRDEGVGWRNGTSPSASGCPSRMTLAIVVYGTLGYTVIIPGRARRSTASTGPSSRSGGSASATRSWRGPGAELFSISLIVGLLVAVVVTAAIAQRSGGLGRSRPRQEEAEDEEEDRDSSRTTSSCAASGGWAARWSTSTGAPEWA